MDGLRVLITNNTLGGRAGSELFVRDLAVGLMRRGHRPVVFSTVLGEVADLLRQATVPVVDDLAALTAVPDVIHGQHHLETMMAALHFPRTPVVHVCHGWQPWEEQPPVHPGIRRHVAIDDLCAERIHTTPGIDPARVRTVYNGVDLERFQPRGPLPDRPRTALIFSNYAGSGSRSHEAIRSACLSHGITRVDVAGSGSGRIAHAPETLLADYDVVFAKARCALEAMAVGCATIVTDYAGLGGMVTTENMQALRRLNFGARTMQASPVTEAALSAQLQRYSKDDAALVSAWIRREAAFDDVVDRFLAIYREALSESVDVPAEAASMAVAAYLRQLSPRLKSLAHAEMRAQAADDACLELASKAEAAQAGEQAALQALAEAESRLLAAEAERSAIESQLAAANASTEALQRRHAACTDDIVDLQTRLLASEAEIQRAVHAAQSSDQAGSALRSRLEQAEQAEQALDRIHASRAWRAVTAYRRLRAWLG